MLLCVSVNALARNHSEQPNYLNSIKATFLSWTSGSTKISYERALPGINQSSEICAGVISAGYDKYSNNPVGFTMRYGHKFFLGSNKDELTLKGFYFRPELVYSYYHYNCTNTHKHCFQLWKYFGSTNKNIALSFSLRLGVCF